jgi:hypothetical protein
MENSKYILDITIQNFKYIVNSPSKYISNVTLENQLFILDIIAKNNEIQNLIDNIPMLDEFKIEIEKRNIELQKSMKNILQLIINENKST